MRDPVIGSMREYLLATPLTPYFAAIAPPGQLQPMWGHAITRKKKRNTELALYQSVGVRHRGGCGERSVHPTRPSLLRAPVLRGYRESRPGVQDPASRVEEKEVRREPITKDSTRLLAALQAGHNSRLSSVSLHSFSLRYYSP